jgi:hypothetical protein
MHYYYCIPCALTAHFHPYPGFASPGLSAFVKTSADKPACVRHSFSDGALASYAGRLFSVALSFNMGSYACCPGLITLPGFLFIGSPDFPLRWEAAIARLP